MTEGLLNTEQAAARLNISRQVMAVWRLTGRGPRFVKVGSRVLYDPQDISTFIEANKRTSTSASRTPDADGKPGSRS